MANPEHLQLLKQGVEVWNAWRRENPAIRPNLIAADLYLRRDPFSHFSWDPPMSIEVHEGYLGKASLSSVDFHAAYLNGANLHGAYLNRANLREAILHEANLHGAYLYGADLSEAWLFDTVFSNTDLTAVRGLETCYHGGPSTLDHRTLAKSGPLPLAFLRGCGLSDWEIEATKLYQPGLTPTQINDIIYRIYGLRADPLIQFHSCFISYANRDQVFAEHLYEDLQNKGVRCWFAPEDMKIGDEFRSRIDTSIHLHDRLLLILSEHSIKSRWVQKEVETAFEKEEKENRLVLFPIRLDDAVVQIDVGWAADIRRQRHIGDFTRWKEHDPYQRAFARLLRDLTATAQKPDASA
jgi:TIR domain-containing protein/pentapeptide repeat protein